MASRVSRTAFLALLTLTLPIACGDDGTGEGGSATESSGDGDGDASGDGDGDASGDGDGEASGDGDGDASGDGDGDSGDGDGDGDASGDGDGDAGDGDGDASGDGDGDTSGDGDGEPGDGDGDTGDGDGDGFECMPAEPPNPPVDCADVGIVLADEFEPFYECYDLGNLPNIPSNWGGLTVKIDDPNTLLIGGAANTPQGKLYAVEITRSEDCHITGWAGSPIEEFAEAAYNDGGVTYGPDDVLFLARWPVNELGQQMLGSVATDKVIALDPLAVVSSPGGLNFVPPGFPGEGQLKLVAWPGGEWYTVLLEPDMMGTFDIAEIIPGTTIEGGPEGFVHIDDANPGFPVDGLLVSEYSAGKLAAYDIDDNGDPIPDTRRDFVTGLTGAEGAYLDLLSGDFLFTTFGGGNRLIAIRGFTPNPQ